MGPESRSVQQVPHLRQSDSAEQGCDHEAFFDESYQCVREGTSFTSSALCEMTRTTWLSEMILLCSGA